MRQRLTHLSQRLLQKSNPLWSGVLLGIGFVIPVLWPAIFFGAALFIYTIRSARSGKVAFFSAWATGFMLHVLALSAVFIHSMPLDWIGINSKVFEIAVVLVGLSFNALMLGLGVGICGLLIKKYADGSWRDIFLIPSCWVLSEWVGAIIIYIVNLGPGSLFGAHFTLGWIGYQLAHNAFLLQAAWGGGVYALSFLAVMFGALLLFALTTKGNTQRIYLSLCAAVVLSASLGHAYMAAPASAVENTGPTLQVAAISRYEPSRLVLTESQDRSMWDRMNHLIQPLQGVDVLVFPENTAFLRALGDTSRREGTAATLTRIGEGSTSPLVIDSEDIRLYQEPLHSRVTYFTGSSTNYSYGYKQFLLPVGEHVPFLYQGVIRMLGGSALLEKVTNVRGYEPGLSGGRGTAKEYLVAARFCDESMSPELYHSQVVSGANVLVNISSLSWFHASPAVYEQMKLIARVRAVESGRWFVQSGNMAPAFVLDDRGRLVAETVWGEVSVLEYAVVPKEDTTPYTLFGSYVLFVPLLLLLISALARSRKERP